jgi:hypothetical protein
MSGQSFKKIRLSPAVGKIAINIPFNLILHRRVAKGKRKEHPSRRQLPRQRNQAQ